MQIPSPLSIASLISNTFSALEKLRTMVKDSKDRALKAEMGVVYDSFGELRKALLDLDEENRRLKQALSERAAIEGPIGVFGYFYRVGDREHPLCPSCYKTKGIDLPLSPLEDWNGGKRRTCDVCGFYRDEEEMKPQTIRLGRGKRYSPRV